MKSSWDNADTTLGSGQFTSERLDNKQQMEEREKDAHGWRDKRWARKRSEWLKYTKDTCRQMPISNKFYPLVEPLKYNSLAQTK